MGPASRAGSSLSETHSKPDGKALSRPVEVFCSEIGFSSRLFSFEPRKPQPREDTDRTLSGLYPYSWFPIVRSEDVYRAF